MSWHRKAVWPGVQLLMVAVGRAPGPPRPCGRPALRFAGPGPGPAGAVRPAGGDRRRVVVRRLASTVTAPPRLHRFRPTPSAASTTAGTGLLVGASFASTVNGTTVGGAGYLFATATSTTWSSSATAFFRAATTGARVGFAGAISPDGQRVALGAPYYTGGGQTLLWQKSGTAWGSSSPVGAGPNNTDAAIGYSVAFGTSSRLVVGSIYQTYQTLTTGEAYLLDLS